MKNLSIEELKELRTLCVDCTVWSSIIDELIAIRELKGDQVPLQQLFKEAIAWGRVYGPTMAKDLWFEMLDTQSCNFAGRFTVPQKPIVSPPLPGGSLKQWQFERDCEWKAAIESAGGVVK
jgi:hypothetical protein